MDLLKVFYNIVGYLIACAISLIWLNITISLSLFFACSIGCFFGELLIYLFKKN